MPRSSLPAADTDTCTIPPLLVAFILDTSDLPNGQALLWNRDAGKVPIDMGLLGSTKGKGKEKERRTGIVLERWTLRAR
jgi:autophagy-related protein 13